MQIIDTVKISIDDIFYTNDKVEVTLDDTGEYKSIKKLYYRMME